MTLEEMGPRIRRRDGRTQHTERRAVRMEHVQRMGRRPRREHRRVFMDAQSSHDPPSGCPSSCSSLGLHGANGPDFVFPSEIPELDLAVAAAGDKFSEAAALHVHVCDPLVVFAPDADHFCRGLEALVEDADGTVAVAGDEGGAFNGIVG